MAIEIDKGLSKALRDICPHENVEILHEDALKADIKAIMSRCEKPYKAVANLPYYITSPLILKLLYEGIFASMTFMVQFEVAKRITAVPKTPEYGALSVLVQRFCKASIEFIVPASCFFPRPKVDSAVIKLDALGAVDGEVKEQFNSVVNISFNKNAKRSLII